MDRIVFSSEALFLTQELGSVVQAEKLLLHFIFFFFKESNAAISLVKDAFWCLLEQHNNPYKHCSLPSSVSSTPESENGLKVQTLCASFLGLELCRLCKSQPSPDMGVLSS